MAITGNASDDLIRFSSQSGGGFRLESEFIAPRPLEDVFAFFSDAFQLQTITPPWLHFSVRTPAPIVITTGTRIDYQIRMHGVPMRWQSVISVWDPPFRFVDEQIKGPYRTWHHEHTFTPVDGGTLCRDVVDYSVFGGALVNALFVRRELRKIFQFRREKLMEIFGAKLEMQNAR